MVLITIVTGLISTNQLITFGGPTSYRDIHMMGPHGPIFHPTPCQMEMVFCGSSAKFLGGKKA